MKKHLPHPRLQRQKTCPPPPRQKHLPSKTKTPAPPEGKKTHTYLGRKKHCLRLKDNKKNKIHS